MLIVFHGSGWNDLFQVISNPDNGLKGNMAEVIQFKNHLSMCCVPNALVTRTNNISTLKGITI